MLFFKIFPTTFYSTFILHLIFYAFPSFIFFDSLQTVPVIFVASREKKVCIIFKFIFRAVLAQFFTGSQFRILLLVRST
jgi:hypothetical protein